MGTLTVLASGSGIIIIKMNKIFLLFFIFFQVTFQAKPGQSRGGRLLLISTVSTTTTVSTTSYCWKSANTAVTAACTGRRRRQLSDLGLDELAELQPTRTGGEVADLENDDLESEEELESGQKENNREGKFLLYWRTTSLTSTTTTYTGTSTIASLECTPSSFNLRLC